MSNLCSSEMFLGVENMFGSCSIEDSITSAECYNDTRVRWPIQNKRKFTVCCDLCKPAEGDSVREIESRYCNVTVILSKGQVTVEGNIGSGKSTFLHYFKQSDKVEVIQEPVEKWQNVHGFNTLDLLYKDAKRWSLTFQSYVQLTMLQNHSKKQTKPVKLMERSLYSARYCFVENLYQAGLMPGVDYAILSEWFDWIIKNSFIDVDLIVYLQASPKACLQRIQKRNRDEESSVPMEYLESLHELHEDWLVRQTKFKLPAPVLVLDASKSLSDLKLDLEKRKELILCGQV